MRKLFSLYWEALAGFRPHVTACLVFTSLSGLMEGVALMFLIPILGRGIASSRPQGVFSYGSIYDILHFPKTHRLTYIFMAFILVGFLSAATRLIADGLMVRLHTRVEQSLRTRMGVALFRMSWPGFLAMRLGDIGKAMLVEGLRTGEACCAFVLMLGFLIVALIFIGISFAISTPLTLITFAFGLLASIGYLWAGRRAGNHARTLSENTTLIGERIAEIFNNLKFVRASGHTGQAMDETSRYYQQCATSYFKSVIYKSLIRFLFETLGIMLIAGFLAYGFFWSGKPMEWAIVFLAVFYRLTPRLQAIQDNYYAAKTLAPWYVSWKMRMDHILQQTHSPSGNLAIPSQPILVFKNVSYQYPDSNAIALLDLSMTIVKGRCVALVGESGSGKSTTIDLLTGLIQPTAGQILVGETSLEQMDIDQWRSRIGLVLQEPTLFNGTVLQNIAWQSASPNIEKAIDCAQMAQAWEFIEHLPKGIHTEVEEKGGRLSGGQRQRIALARALYGDPWLLVLDEPTSELDAESEDRILKALQAIKDRYAILIVSHRLKMVQLADYILVLDHGIVREQGDWKNLASIPDGLFHALSRRQTTENPH